jgi:hypothetical protein
VKKKNRRTLSFQSCRRATKQPQLAFLWTTIAWKNKYLWDAFNMVGILLLGAKHNWHIFLFASPYPSFCYTLRLYFFCLSTHLKHNIQLYYVPGPLSALKVLVFVINKTYAFSSWKSP